MRDNSAVLNTTNTIKTLRINKLKFKIMKASKFDNGFFIGFFTATILCSMAFALIMDSLNDKLEKVIEKTELRK